MKIIKNKNDSTKAIARGRGEEHIVQILLRIFLIAYVTVYYMAL